MISRPWVLLTTRWLLWLGLALLAVLTAMSLGVTVANADGGTKATVFATGLDNPRGLKFGPDGNLYVAEGGRGGTRTTTDAQCAQVVAPVGPYSGAMTARISKIDHSGHRSTVVSGLPSSQTSPALGSLVSGVSDVAFLGNQLYAITAGAGCSHGLAGTNNMVIRVDRSSHTWKQIANLSSYLTKHPVAHPEADDFEPDGTWYSMIAVGGNLYAVEPNHGELDRITPSGRISRVVDVSASQGHIVPTSLAYRDRFFIGNLGVFPVTAGSEKVLRLGSDHQLSTRASGLTTVVGLAFGRHGGLYALELTSVSGDGPTPGTGMIVRLDASGKQTVIASGLMFPTAMTFDPSHQYLYVSTFGFGFGAGAGKVERVRVPD